MFGSIVGFYLSFLPVAIWLDSWAFESLSVLQTVLCVEDLAPSPFVVSSESDGEGQSMEACCYTGGPAVPGGREGACGIPRGPSGNGPQLPGGQEGLQEGTGSSGGAAQTEAHCGALYCIV